VYLLYYTVCAYLHYDCVLLLEYVCTDNTVESAGAGSLRCLCHSLWVVVWLAGLPWRTLWVTPPAY